MSDKKREIHASSNQGSAECHHHPCGHRNRGLVWPSITDFRTTRIAVLNILSIAPSGAMKESLFILKHRDGKVQLDPKLNAMHELIAELKRHLR